MKSHQSIQQTSQDKWNLKDLLHSPIRLHRDKRRLGKLITLLQSQNPEDDTTKEELSHYIKDLLKQKYQSTTTFFPPEAFTIGVTGTPGAGKSSFLQTLLPVLEKKWGPIALLCIDPTSPVSGGSLLGDRIRFQDFHNQTHIFIRSIPQGIEHQKIELTLFPVIQLLYYAGFSNVFIESVGVGQSEYSLKKWCHRFVTLLSPDTGDDIQGLKKGLNEVSDLTLITKADGEHKNQAELLATSYQIGKSGHSSQQLVFAISSKEFYQIDKVIEWVEKERQIWSKDSFVQYQTRLDHFTYLSALEKIQKHVKNCFDDAYKQNKNQWEKEDNPFLRTKKCYLNLLNAIKLK